MRKHFFLRGYTLDSRKGDKDTILCGTLTTVPEETYLVQTLSVNSQAKDKDHCNKKFEK
jgi:hypothetical protein